LRHRCHFTNQVDTEKPLDHHQPWYACLCRRPSRRSQCSVLSHCRASR